jgi:hypothetical protein
MGQMAISVAIAQSGCKAKPIASGENGLVVAPTDKGVVQGRKR